MRANANRDAGAAHHDSCRANGNARSTDGNTGPAKPNDCAADRNARGNCIADCRRRDQSPDRRGLYGDEHARRTCRVRHR